MIDHNFAAFVRRCGFRANYSSRAARKRLENLQAARDRANPIYRTDLPPVAPAPVMIEGADVRSPEFLQTFAWRRLRYRALKEAAGKCECCGAVPSDGIKLNVDHIQPRQRRPDRALDIYNLQVLCGDCNAGKGNWDQTDWR